MTSNVYKIPNFSGFGIYTYSRFNLSKSQSDICVFVKEYKDRIKEQLQHEDENEKTPFPSFAERKPISTNTDWQKDNYKNFFQNTPNESFLKLNFLSELGNIFCMVYSPNGKYVVVGYSTGLIQMRHGITGIVLSTLRNIQFPPKPIYSICFSRLDDKVCYAACMDGHVYRIEIPNINFPTEESPKLCIRADPGLESLNTQFYGAPGMASFAQSFIYQRSPALSMGVTAEETKMVVGYGDTSIKIYDMETQEAEVTYKVHKLRLQFVPKKLQRMHFGQVCALRCHDDKPFLFASGAWDKTLRIWDVRCKVGCVMTFEGVDICSDSIDLNRDQCIAGSWQPTEALGVWDLVARKRLNIIRVQNRRPDVDGEYIYACRYWRSSEFNRKGKYAIIGGSGTNCVEVINLHNRYITCSYPAPGAVLAVTSHEDRIAFGGTASVFNIVSFHDPKHEKYEVPEDSEYDITKSVTLFRDDVESLDSQYEGDGARSDTGAMADEASVLPTIVDPSDMSA